MSRNITRRVRSLAKKYAEHAHTSGRVTDMIERIASIGATSARLGSRNASTAVGATTPSPITSGAVRSENSASERISPWTRRWGSSRAYDGNNASIACSATNVGFSATLYATL